MPATATTIVFGGSGADTITTGNGGSIIFGDNGSVYYRSPGVPGTVQTTNTGVGANDTITAGTGNNTIFGGSGSDNYRRSRRHRQQHHHRSRRAYSVLYNRHCQPDRTTDPQLAQNEQIVAGNGKNIIFGGSGADAITSGNGNSIIFGDNGSVQYQSPGVLGTVQSTYATNGANDTITAGTGNNIIFGGTGSDNITAGLGGRGNNIIFGEDGSIQFFPAGSPSLAQSIDVQLASNNIINAGNGNNIIFGGSGSNTLTAGNGSNIIFGSNGQVSYQSPGVLGTAQTTNSSIGGNDTITAGNGSDYVFGGYGSNTITLGGTTTPDPRTSSASIVIGHSGEIDFDQQGLFPKDAYSVDNYLGGDDVIRVAGGNNLIIGGAGDNWLFGGTGNDIIFGAGGRVA